METLSNLIANPLDAMISTITGEQTAAAAPVDPPGNATFTEDVLRMLIYNLFQGDSRLQQQVLTDYYSPDVSFSLNGDFLKLTGRDELQQLLRGSQLLASYKPEVLEISSNEDKAVILLNLNLSYKLLPLTWWAPLHIITTVTLNFGPNPNPIAAAADYADLIIGHHQEMSVVDLLWWNPAWEWFNRRIWSRISGKTLAAIYHVEEPLVSKLISYLDSGAGWLQALLWSLEDIARSSGFQGLPSAAVKLNLIPSRKPSPPQPSLPPPPPQAAAAADIGLTEAPQTPTQETAASRAALPGPPAAAAAVSGSTASTISAGTVRPAAAVSTAPVVAGEAAPPVPRPGAPGAAGEPAAAAAAAAAESAPSAAAAAPVSAERAAGVPSVTAMKAAAPGAATAVTAQEATSAAPEAPEVTAPSEAAAGSEIIAAPQPSARPEPAITDTTEVPVATQGPEAVAAAEQPSAAASAAAAGSAAEDMRGTSSIVEGGAGGAPVSAPAAAAVRAEGEPAATAGDVARVAADVQQVLQLSRPPAVVESAAGPGAGTKQASSSKSGADVAREAAAAAAAGLKVEGAEKGKQQLQEQQQLKPEPTEVKKQGSSKGIRKHKKSGSRK